MKIAVIGSGISGLTAAYYLNRDHDVTVYEAQDHVGGHTATKRVRMDGRDYQVDTGFIVFNDWTYPDFISLLRQLGVETDLSSMSFSVQCRQSGIEYAGANLNSLFAQRRNLLRPSHYRMLLDIVRFNRQCTAELAAGTLRPDLTVEGYVRQGGYSEAFAKRYLLPMCGAIWSAPTGRIGAMPLLFFARFFHNHGMLSVSERPAWRVVRGGSARYVEALTATLARPVRINTPVRSVRRLSQSVELSAGGDTQRFDQLVMATHSDQALALLGDASRVERDVLGAIPYQANEVTLHCDPSLLPRRQRCWSSWNVLLDASAQAPLRMTYNMNILQGLPAPRPICVSLNSGDRIDPEKTFSRHEYHHPVFNTDSVRAQQRHHEISGVNRTHYCGAYWSNGFHEDGVRSGLRVVEAINGGKARAA